MFIQPLFMQFEFGPFQRIHEILRRTDADIGPAVNLWCSNRVEAEERYGHIGYWDVSSVTNMMELFRRKAKFNDDITHWDVSNVTDMDSMFWDARTFNQAIGNWDVSKVTDMSFMFSGARGFNQPIGAWDVSNVTSERVMFANCPISNANKPARFRGGGAKQTRRATRRGSRKRLRKGTRSRKGRRTLKRGSRR
jgi:surface protein